MTRDKRKPSGPFYTTWFSDYENFEFLNSQSSFAKILSEKTSHKTAVKGELLILKESATDIPIRE